MIWECLGLHFEKFEYSFGREESWEASWAVLGALVFMLVFGVLFKSAIGGIWARFSLAFKRFGKDVGKVWTGFWDGFEMDFIGFWMVLGYCALF